MAGNGGALIWPQRVGFVRAKPRYQKFESISAPAESRANHRFQPPVVKRLGEDETLVALRRDFRTSLAIAADALGTEIGQKRARFAWDVGPGVGVWCRKRGAFGTCFALTSP